MNRKKIITFINSLGGVDFMIVGIVIIIILLYYFF